MRYFVIFFSLCLATVFSTPLEDPSSTDVQLKGGRLGIYDGTVTTIEQHPYLVRLYGEGEFWCAASIVSDSWVVTTAECATLADNLPAKLTIVAGSNGTAGEGTNYTVSKVVVHPAYDQNNFDYSYVCIQVNGTFTWSDTMQPLMLPSANPYTGATYTVAGWGLEDYDDDTYDTLREGDMIWMPKFYCSILYAKDGWFLTDRQGCALNKRKTTLCTGDIGDPMTQGGVYYGLFTYPNPGRYGDACTSGAKAVLIAKVYPVVYWIKETTGAELA